ncbi:IS110 family transposase [Aeoliella sp. ICT_H6.2]|uniref:IS110 family transposase n=1 Tax=Aeoliella straminimaris TaxID=2954799 RepID=A0A9X2JEJ5_9BACT|nr:IS110 family transposase [Aeoliella straminimaris]MCO6042716.1 IS110 family transposase [Aeoliella straminimaris]
MLYLAIDQHAKQLTVCVRNEDGDTVLRRQVSTRPEKIEAFFEQFTKMAPEFMAILEVCGFNDWLIEELRKWNCREIVLIHPEKPSKKKTDRRDAQKLADLLWLNRQRLAAGQVVRGLRRVYMVTQQEREDRQLTSLRKNLGQRRIRVLNKIRRLVNRYNLIWQYPTKTFQTRTGRSWLAAVPLPPIDRLEMDMLLKEWEICDEQIAQVDNEIAERVSRTVPVGLMNATQILMTIPGVSHYSGLTLASRIGPIERFPRPRSLANYFGLTPGCRNSGNAQDRLGSITKQGSKTARFILGQLVVHLLKHDPKMREWYRQIKLRRGSKIARVAVMRRITTILWHMLTYQEPYSIGGPPPRLRKDGTSATHAA